jgi:hypothetical protein
MTVVAVVSSSPSRLRRAHVQKLSARRMTVRCHSASWPRGGRARRRVGPVGRRRYVQEFVEGGDGGAVALDLVGHGRCCDTTAAWPARQRRRLLPGRAAARASSARRGQKTQMARITMMTTANARIAIVRVFTAPPRRLDGGGIVAVLWRVRPAPRRASSDARFGTRRPMRPAPRGRAPGQPPVPPATAGKRRCRIRW